MARLLLIDRLFPLPALAFGVSAAVGICFGVVPARRAARLDPVAALPNEESVPNEELDEVVPVRRARAPLAAIFGDLTSAQRGRLLEQFAKTDKAVSGLAERMRILTDSDWTTRGLTVDDHPGWPRKVSLSAYVADGRALTFALELVGEPSSWRIYADVSARASPDAEPQVALAMEAIDCSTVDNAAIGLTLASQWLQSVSDS